MAQAPKGNEQARSNEKDTFDQEEYDDMALLEMLETLREDMEDLGVTTLAEVIERIEALHKKLDG
jgi:hypothetical protein